VQEFLANLIEQVTTHPLVHVLTETTVTDHSGFKGNFETGLVHGPTKNATKLQHGIVVIATGGQELKPKGLYGYGEHASVMTQLELEGAWSMGR